MRSTLYIWKTLGFKLHFGIFLLCWVEYHDGGVWRRREGLRLGLADRLWMVKHTKRWRAKSGGSCRGYWAQRGPACIWARGTGARHVVGSLSETYGGNLYRKEREGGGKWKWKDMRQKEKEVQGVKGFRGDVEGKIEEGKKGRRG